MLRTNTDPRVARQRYMEVSHAERHSRPAQEAERRGAAGLFVPKKTCFVYPNLRSEDAIPCLAPLVRAYRELPKSRRRITTILDGKSVGVSVEVVGTGKHDNLLICIPGVMSDSTEYRFIVGALAEDYDFWLIDPPGCGFSDAPDPKRLGPGAYSPRAMADRELQAIAACFSQGPRPGRAVLVAHSLGGLAALRAFGDPDLKGRYAQVLARIEGLVLLSPANVFMSQANASMADRADLSGIKVAIGQGLGMVQEAVARYLAGSFYASHCLSREEVDHAVRVLNNAGTRNAFQAMLHEALAFNLKTRQPNFEAMTFQEGWYANVDVPCRVIWGKYDQTLPVAMGYMLEHQLPNARLTVLPDCKHAPNLERPRDCARLIREADRAIAASTAVAKPLHLTARDSREFSGNN